MKDDFTKEALAYGKDQMINQLEGFLSDRVETINAICESYGITKENAALLTKEESNVNGVNTILIKLRSNLIEQEDTYLEITESYGIEQTNDNTFISTVTIKDRLVKKPIVKKFEFKINKEETKELLERAFRLGYTSTINKEGYIENTATDEFLDIIRSFKDKENLEFFQNLAIETYNCGSMKKNLEKQLIEIGEKLDEDKIREIKSNIEFLERYPIDLFRRKAIDKDYDIMNLLYKA